MNKKDRIAVVVSIFYFFFVCLFSLLEGELSGAIFLTPLIGYWSYRFIKNDISFLRVKDE